MNNEMDMYLFLATVCGNDDECNCGVLPSNLHLHHLQEKKKGEELLGEEPAATTDTNEEEDAHSRRAKVVRSFWILCIVASGVLAARE